VISFLTINEESEKPKKKITVQRIVAITCAIGMLSVGTTLATVITLNSNETIEFGQGVLTTTACDSNGINVLPLQSYLNAPGTGKFTFNAIQLDNISGNCAGKDLIIRVYDENGVPLPLTSDESVTQIRIYFQPMDSGLLIGDNDDEPTTVNSIGYWAQQFTLSGSPPPTSVTVTAIGNLTPKPNTSPTVGLVASDYYEIDPAENSFQMAIDPSGDFILGFSDARDAYKISIESKEHIA